MKYMYYALFTFDDEGKVEVTFPDHGNGAATFGGNVPDALYMAKDALVGYLLTMEDYGDKIPQATTDPRQIKHNQNQLVVPIEVNTTIAREREQNRNVKKTLVIPQYLNDLGNEQRINFSATLTNALKEQLGVKDK
ncbi:type II toxin-antitoxin system HicB family antitoxin [Lentilactobacillus farraginis]|nr:phage-related protein [Lentilactobacillus farraginis DSM 18382 = JCM 14108]